MNSLSSFIVTCILLITAFELYPYLSSGNHKISSSIARSRITSQPSCLILGDSQMAAALRNNIRPCINMAAGGTNVFSMQVIASSFFERHSKVERIIIGLAPQYFSEDRSSPSESITFEGISEYFYNNRLNPLFVNPIIASEYKQFLSLSPLRDLIRKSNLLSSTDISTDNNSASTIVSFHKRAAKQSPVQSFSASPMADSYSKLIRMLSHHADLVCIVRTPVKPSYFSVLNKLYDQAEWHDFVASLIYSNVKYIDLHSSDFVPSPIRFSDMDHISNMSSPSLSAYVSKMCNIDN